MTRILQIVMAGVMCCLLAFSAAAQDQGGRGKGGKQPRDIPVEPKRGDNGNQGRNAGNGNRGDKGDRGEKGDKGGKRPHDI